MAAAAPTDHILRVTDLTVTYQRDDTTDTALDSVSVTIPRGRVTAIIGESGSGKSTLAHAIVRLLPRNGAITSGIVHFEGEDVLQRSDKAFRPLRGRNIGFVPQDPIASLNPTKTIGAQLRESFKLAGSALSPSAITEQMSDDLREIGFADPVALQRQYPHELSGGMRQRVLVAIAFSQRPSLVIADEPTSALDVLVGQDVLRSIHLARTQHHSTVVLITHDLALASRNADHVIVLDKGVVVEDGPVSTVFVDPQHRYTKELLTSSARVHDGRVLTIAESFRRSDRVALPASTDAEPAIRLTDVRKRFGTARRGTQAVDGISLEVPRGSTFALVGESGSGKTTTSRIILGLEQADSGEVSVLGRDVGSLGRRDMRDLRRQVQVVYQSPFESLNPRLDLAAIIGEPLAAFGVGDRSSRRRRVAELLDLVQLPPAYADRRPRELSGGQRQRVAIARAIAVEPQVVVLDEPVSALDATIQAQVLTLLIDIQRELGLTYFLVTHDLAVVADVAQQVAVMRHGRLVEAGRVGDVVLEPADDYTRALLAV